MNIKQCPVSIEYKRFELRRSSRIGCHFSFDFSAASRRLRPLLSSHTLSLKYGTLWLVVVLISTVILRNHFPFKDLKLVATCPAPLNHIASGNDCGPLNTDNGGIGQVSLRQKNLNQFSEKGVIGPSGFLT
jgi:hypothetical protein